MTVHLYDTTSLALIASKVTRSNVAYYFGKTDGLLANTLYRVHLDNAANYASRCPSAGPAFSRAHVSDNQIDSDANFNVFATITLPTGIAGNNNHSFHIGFGNFLVKRLLRSQQPQLLRFLSYNA